MISLFLRPVVPAWPRPPLTCLLLGNVENLYSRSMDQDLTPLGLDGFAEPTDQGLSLDELSQAYAALLKRGNDPYQAELDPPGDALLAPAVELPAVIRGEDEGTCEITPRSI